MKMTSLYNTKKHRLAGWPVRHLGSCWFLAPIDCSKIPSAAVTTSQRHERLRELIELGVSYESSESSQNPVKFLDKDTGVFKTYDLQKTPLMSLYNPELCS